MLRSEDVENLGGAKVYSFQMESARYPNKSEWYGWRWDYPMVRKTGAMTDSPKLVV